MLDARDRLVPAPALPNGRVRTLDPGGPVICDLEDLVELGPARPLVERTAAFVSGTELRAVARSRFTHTIGPRALDHVCRHRNLTSAQERDLAKALGTALARFEGRIGTFASAYFLGQCAHECGEFVFRREIWDGKGAQAGYWKRRELQGPGPLFPALGKRARGGGDIQTTGRNNYRTAARRLRRPESHWGRVADSASTSDLMCAFLGALWWADHFPANMSGSTWNVERVTRTVNGGVNGLAERKIYTARAMDVREFLDPEPL